MIGPSWRSPWAGYTRNWWRWYLNVPYWFRMCKWLWQRATRGWADCDVWGFDTYLAEVIAGGLRLLKEKKGTPASCFGEHWEDPSDEQIVAARALWHSKLDAMIEAFQVHAAGEIPDRFWIDDKKEPWGGRLLYPEYKDWRDQQQEALKKALEMFAEEFQALWD